MTRSLAVRSLLGLTVAVVACAAQEAPTLTAARAAYLAGDYEQAEESYRALLEQAPEAAQRGLLVTLLTVGEYEAAEDQARGNDALAYFLGEALRYQGELEEARQAYEAASQARGIDWLPAEVRLGELELRSGERAAALARFDRFIDVYNNATNMSARDLVAVGDAVKYLAVTNSDLVYDAQKAYNEAGRADASDPLPRLRLAQLHLDKYQSGLATDEVRAGLAMAAKDPSLMLASAEVLDFDGQPGGAEIVDSVLEINPNSVPARMLRARARLKAEDLEGAREIAEEALVIDRSSLEAQSLIATTYLLAGDDAEFARRVAQILEVNAQYADLFADAAELAANHRWYQEAADLAKRGAEIDSLHARTIAVWGVNQLRVGEIEEGQANLERAFEMDPFNVWSFNTLELLDTFERYESIETTNFEMFIDGRESQLLGPYMGAVAEEALSVLGARYGTLPPLPIRVEVFPSHADFSVRTVGLAGLGALGVSFGSLLAMDSPSARGEGEFNWASTLWHEVAHSFHLAISDHHVPRWFTEGLAVWEQRRYRPGWGHSVTPAFLGAYAGEQLRPVSRLNEGFVRPRFPGEVPLSYLLASLVTERIEAEYGFDAIVAFLEGFRDGYSTNELITRVLGRDPEEFDEEFDDWIRDRFQAGFASTAGGPPHEAGTPLDQVAGMDPNSFFSQLRLGELNLQNDDIEGAIRAFEKANELFPEYGGPDSPNWYLGRIHADADRLDQADEALTRLMNRTESHLPGAELLADVRTRRDDPEGAAAAWGRAIEIAPFTPEPHTHRAEIFEGLQRWSDAALEREALVALNPVDRATALYRWAVALNRAGDRAEARRRVVEALEIAPGYEEALELLLELRQSG